MKTFRNYQLPATIPVYKPRTRDTIAARNREIKKISAVLHLKFAPMDASGKVRNAG